MLVHKCKMFNYSECVLLNVKQLGLGKQKASKLSFGRVWVSTLLNGLDSSPCMPDRLYIKLSKEPWGLEKYSSISGAIGQWSLTHASFNITMINKGSKQIPKTLADCHCFARMALLAQTFPANTHTHIHTVANTVKPVQFCMGLLWQV